MKPFIPDPSFCKVTYTCALNASPVISTLPCNDQVNTFFDGDEATFTLQLDYTKYDVFVPGPYEYVVTGTVGNVTTIS